MTIKTGRWLDTLGATASWACAVHCLALPLFITLLPFVGLSFLLSETTERVFIGISVVIAVSSLLPAYFRQHGKLRPALLAIAGIGLIILTHLWFEENLTLKIIFLIAGALFLTAAHFFNRRLCRACEICQ